MKEDRRLEEESPNVYVLNITWVIRSRRKQLTLNCSSVIRWKLVVLSWVSFPFHIILQQKISFIAFLFSPSCDMLRPCKKGLKPRGITWVLQMLIRSYFEQKQFCTHLIFPESCLLYYLVILCKFSWKYMMYVLTIYMFLKRTLVAAAATLMKIRMVTTRH
jgi:hypothetical protein